MDIVQEKKEDIQTIEKTGTQKELAILYSKIAKIMGSISTIEKTGYNKFDGYNYITAEDIKETLRPLCARENLWISSEIKNYDKNIIKTTTGSYTEIELHIYFTFCCGDTGAKVRLLYSGYALDKGDKHIYKAYTGAMKYFLINNFMLSAGDDPETDSPEIDYTNTINDTANNKNNNYSYSTIQEKDALDTSTFTKSKYNNQKLSEIRTLWKEAPEIVQDIAFTYLESIKKEKDISLLSELKDKQLDIVLERINESLNEKEEELITTK
jgi:hypothetical protein